MRSGTVPSRVRAGSGPGCGTYAAFFIASLRLRITS